MIVGKHPRSARGDKVAVAGEDRADIGRGQTHPVHPHFGEGKVFTAARQPAGVSSAILTQIIDHPFDLTNRYRHYLRVPNPFEQDEMDFLPLLLLVFPKGLPYRPASISMLRGRPKAARDARSFHFPLRKEAHGSGEPGRGAHPQTYRPAVPGRCAFSTAWPRVWPKLSFLRSPTPARPERRSRPSPSGQ